MLTVNVMMDDGSTREAYAGEVAEDAVRVSQVWRNVDGVYRVTIHTEDGRAINAS